MVNDRKMPKDTTGNGLADYYLPTILSVSDYYPFGMQMPGRSLTSNLYRYGFKDERMFPQGECLGDIQMSEPEGMGGKKIMMENLAILK